MSNFEQELLTKLLRKKQLSKVLGAGVSSKFFFDPTCRHAFSWVVKKYEELGDIPSVEVVKAEFPDFEPIHSRDTVSVLIDRVQDKKLYTDLQGALEIIARTTTDDAKKGLEELRKASVRLSSVHAGKTDTDTRKTSVVREMYEAAKRSKGMLGIPYPWPEMNVATKGIRPGELIAFYGPPGTMKTWLLIVIADHLHALGKTPILFTHEMPKEAIQYRHAAYRAKVDYESFQEGRLTPKAERRFYEAITKLENDPPFWIVDLQDAGDAAISTIQSKIREVEADVGLVDGLSFVTEDLEWTSFGKAIIGLKNVAKRTTIPLIATHHTNRAGKKNKKDSADTSDVALGDTLHRHVDVLARLVYEQKQEEDEEILISLKKVREGKRRRFAIHAKPATCFDEKYRTDESLAELGVDYCGDAV